MSDIKSQIKDLNEKIKLIIKNPKQSINNSKEIINYNKQIESLLRNTNLNNKNEVPLEISFKNIGGTIINTNTIIDQTYIDNNIGPYTVEGGTINNPLIITLDYTLNINANTYFIINCDYVKITSGFTYLTLDNVSNYIGLVQNMNNNNILIENISIIGTNSTLNPGAGWIAGSNFGIGCINNIINSCYSHLPIPYNSGGIVGSNSIVNIYYCGNSGEILELYDPDITYLQSSNSGGIYGNNCSGICTNCSNYGIINGSFSGGIIGGLPNNNFTLDSCYNFGNINGGIIQYSAGIISSSPYKETFSISNCVNYGIVNNSCSGIIKVINTNISQIQSCVNYGNLIGGFSSGILGSNNSGLNVNIIDCINYGNILGTESYGIAYNNPPPFAGKSSINALNCKNYGIISGQKSGGIIGPYSKYIIANNCTNYGNISGLYSGGIFTYNTSDCSVIECSNTGNIESENAGGIIGQDSVIIIENCINSGIISGIGAGGIAGAGSGCVINNCTNNGEINGINAGGIFGAWSNGSAQDCVNTGSIIGVSSGGIYGEFSTGVSTNCVNSAHLVAVNSRNI